MFVIYTKSQPLSVVAEVYLLFSTRVHARGGYKSKKHRNIRNLREKKVKRVTDQSIRRVS